MPNIVGIFDSNLSQEKIQNVLLKQLGRVRVPAIFYSEHSGVYQGFGMALQDHGILGNGVQPVCSDDGRYALILDGEFYNGHELRRQFQGKFTSPHISDPKLCLELFAMRGDQAVLLLNGLFCIVLYDRKIQCMKIFSDRFGFRPMFYVVRDSSLIFASEMKAICVVDRGQRQVDEVGILSLFAFGSHIMHRTWLNGYSRLAPGTILTMTNRGMQIEKYWSYQYDEQEKTLDQETYFTNARVLIDRAVERSMKGDRPIGVFLSGGYDSRVIAAAIRSHHLPMPAFTFGHPESRDIQYAGMLAKRLGLTSYPLTDHSPYLYKNCHAIVWRTEGMLPFYSTTSIRYHPFIKSLVDIVFVGFLGEFWGSHTWPKLLLARTREATIEAVFERILRRSAESLKDIFHASFLKEVFPCIHEEFAQSFECLQNEHPLNVADSWRYRFFQPRTSYHSTSIDRYLFEVRSPLLDFELVEFLLKIPPCSRLEQRVYKKTIAYGFPTIRDIPCTNSGLPVNPKFLQEYFLMMIRYIGRKTTAPVSKFFGAKASLGREFQSPDEDLRAEPEMLEKVLRPLIRDGIFPEHIFDYGKIEKMLDEHSRGNRGHYETIFLLISVGLALKFFLYDDVTDVPLDMYAPE